MWDLGVGALLAGELLRKRNLVETLSEVIERTSRGERYRLTPGFPTLLTRCERLALRYVALSLTHGRIARQLHVDIFSIHQEL